MLFNKFQSMLLRTGLHRLRLFCQYSGQHQRAAQRNQVRQSHAKQPDDDRRQDIRQHQARLPEREFGQF